MDAPLLELLAAVIGLLAVGGGYVGWRSVDRRRRPPLAPTIDGAQEAEIEVRHGYRPSAVRVRAGQPVRLRFRRLEDDPCSARVYLADPPLSRQLVPFATTAITFTPQHVGRHLFTCEEGRHRGYLIVEAPAARWRSRGDTAASAMRDWFAGGESARNVAPSAVISGGAFSRVRTVLSQPRHRLASPPIQRVAP